jgi:hypothetical protein
MLHPHLALTQTAAEWHASLAESHEDLLDAVWRAEAGWRLDDRLDLAVRALADNDLTSESSPSHEPVSAPDHDPAAGAGSPSELHTLPPFVRLGGVIAAPSSHRAGGGIPGHQPHKEA